MKPIKSFVYGLIDLFTLHKGIPRCINGFKILFPAKWARYFESDYEKENVQFLIQNAKPGMTMIDIGAHLGLISVSLAQLVGKNGRVYAFEPTPLTFSNLNKIIVLNKFESIIFPYNQAVSKENGSVDFYLAEDEGSNSNSLVQKNHRQREAVKIETISIDSFMTTHKVAQLDLLKIDAEGSELDVLAGAQQSLLKFRPKVILALHPPLITNNNQSLEAIYRLLKQLNYQILLHHNELDERAFCSMSDFFDVHLIPNN